MQKISTRVFIGASVAFGIVGLCFVIFGGRGGADPVSQILSRLLMACVFVILPSFALSVADRYLNGR